LQSKGVIDSAFTYAVDLAERKGTESMIFKQALGQPLSGATSFSEVALMAQAGRLPIIPIQQAASWAIADALKIGLQWIKTEPRQQYKVSEKGARYDLTASIIPDHFELEVSLEVKLPQDKLQQANIAQMLRREGITSLRWIQENLLNIPQSEDMQQEVWTERALEAMFNAWLQRKVQEIAAPPQPPQPPQGAPMGGPAMGGGMQGLPPELATMGAQGPAGQGPEMGGNGSNPLEQMMGGGEYTGGLA
jgi:hypothetical protein